MPVRPLPVIVIAAGLLGCEKPQPPAPQVQEAQAAVSPGHPPPGAHNPEPKAPPKPPEERRMYKLDYFLATTDPGKPTVNTAHSLNIEEGSVGEIRLGRNVPLTTPGASADPAVGRAAPRLDVGFLLRCSFNPVGDDLTLHTDLELSSADQPPAIQKVVLRGDALVSPGKTAIVSSAEDIATHTRYQLSVTATKLR